MSVQLFQDGILPGGADKVLPPEWVFFAPLTDNLNAAGKGDTTPTFTRATIATHKNGALELEAVGSGVPRFSPFGIFIEGQRTNILDYSEDLDNGSAVAGPWWRWPSLDVSGQIHPSPYPGLTNVATALLDGPANEWHSIFNYYTGGANQKDALSVLGKSAGRDWCFVACWDAVGGACEQYFNVATGQVGSKSEAGGITILSAEMEEYIDGWWRLKIHVQTAANTARAMEIGPALSDGVGSYTGGSFTVGTYFIGAQVEANVDFVSSYIPTVAAGVTRNQDKLTYPADNTPVNDGTIEAEFTKYYLGTGSQGAILETTSAINQQGGRFSTIDSGRVVWKLVKLGIESQIETPGWSYTPYVSTHVFAPYELNFSTLYTDGYRWGTSFTVDPPTVQNLISVGMTGSEVLPLWGWVRNVRLWETRRTP